MHNVAVVFGIFQIQGFAEGDDVVLIEPEANDFEDIVGADGTVMRSQTNDRRVTVTIKLLPTSISNKELMGIYNADRTSFTGAFPMLIQDKHLNESYAITEAWIQKMPNIGKGQTATSYDWVFRGSPFYAVIT